MNKVMSIILNSKKIMQVIQLKNKYEGEWCDMYKNVQQ